MIEQDNLSNDVIKPSPLTREITFTPKPTPDQEYQQIMDEVIDKRNWQLRIDMYCLSDQDFDDSPFSHFQKEAGRVDTEWRKSPEQVKHDLQKDVLAEIFRRNSPKANEAVIFEESSQVA